MQVSRLSNISFDFRPIWLQTLVMIDSESRQIQNHGDHLHALLESERFVINLLLKIIIYCVTDQPSIT